eukprot:5872634-Pleurochrysis_carterae.AAC.1
MPHDPPVVTRRMRPSHFPQFLMFGARIGRGCGGESGACEAGGNAGRRREEGGGRVNTAKRWSWVANLELDGEDDVSLSVTPPRSP